MPNSTLTTRLANSSHSQVTCIAQSSVAYMHEMMDIEKQCKKQKIETRFATPWFAHLFSFLNKLTISTTSKELSYFFRRDIYWTHVTNPRRLFFYRRNDLCFQTHIHFISKSSLSSVTLVLDCFSHLSFVTPIHVAWVSLLLVHQNLHLRRSSKRNHCLCNKTWRNGYYFILFYFPGSSYLYNLTNHETCQIIVWLVETPEHREHKQPHHFKISCKTINPW